MNGADKLEAIYSPETGRVACVLLQAGFKGSQAVARMFPADHWDTGIRPTMRRMAATYDEWKQIATMPIEERISRWGANRGEPS